MLLIKKMYKKFDRFDQAILFKKLFQAVILFLQKIVLDINLNLLQDLKLIKNIRFLHE